MTVGRLEPDHGEALSTFLKRAVRERGVSIRQLARALDGEAGKKDSTWERQLRLWGNAESLSLDPENARAVGAKLNADFSAYATRRMEPRDVLGEVLQHLDELDRRVAALEEQ